MKKNHEERQTGEAVAEEDGALLKPGPGLWFGFSQCSDFQKYNKFSIMPQLVAVDDLLPFLIQTVFLSLFLISQNNKSTSIFTSHPSLFSFISLSSTVGSRAGGSHQQGEAEGRPAGGVRGERSRRCAAAKQNVTQSVGSELVCRRSD